MPSRYLPLFFIGSLCGLASSSCTADKPTKLHGDEALFQRFSQALQPPLGKENCGTYQVDLGKITNFAWDSVYALTANSYSTDSVDYHLGDIVWHGPAFGDSYRRLAFVYQKKVVSYIDCSMVDDPYNGEKSMNILLDDSCHGSYEVLSRANALLLTSHIVEGKMTTYPLIPADCMPEAHRNLAADCPR
jgi:hypothetical protein